MEKTAIFVENVQKEHLNNKIDFAEKENDINREFQKYSYQDFREFTNILCHTCFRIFYIYYGLLQFFATKAALIKVFHYDNIITSLISFILGFCPFIGPFFGIWGAHSVWEWSISYSSLIFIAPYFLANSPIFLIIIYEICKDVKRWKAEENIHNNSKQELQFKPETVG